MVRGAKLRRVMSWIMRRRSGVMASPPAEVRRGRRGDARLMMSQPGWGGEMAGAGWGDQDEPRLDGRGGARMKWELEAVGGAVIRTSTAKRFRSTSVFFAHISTLK